MLLHRHLCANALDSVNIDFSQRKAESGLGALGNDFTPRIYDERVPEGLSPPRMSTLLSGSCHPTLIFDRPRAKKDVPMGHSSSPGESGGNSDQLRPVIRQPLKEFRKPEIVTNTESRRHSAYTRHDGYRPRIRRRALLRRRSIAQVDVE